IARRSSSPPPASGTAAGPHPRIPRSSSAAPPPREAPRACRAPEAASPLGLLPERFQFLDRCIRHGAPLRFHAPLHMPEALPELRIRPPQSLLRIHFHEPRQIHNHKQQIAQLILDLILRPALTRFAELRPLF